MATSQFQSSRGLTSPIAQWALLISILLILGSAIGWSLYSEHEAIDKRERERLSTQAEVIEKNVVPQLLLANRVIEGILGELPRWQALHDGFKYANRQLHVINDTLIGINPILVIQADGKVIASSNDLLVGQNFRQREYFQTAIRNPDPGVLHVSAPFRTVLDTFVISLFQTIRGPKGEFAGIVIVSVVPEYFSVLLDSVRYAPDVWSGLSHSDGKLFLMMPPHDASEGMDLAVPGSFFTRYRDAGQKASVMTGVVYSTGENRMIAQRTIAVPHLPMDKSLVVAVSRDLPGIFEDWRDDLYIRSGMYAMLVLATVLSLFLYQQRQRAYARLLSGVEAVRKKAEEALKDSEATLQLFVDHAPAALAMFDRSMRYLSVSRRWKTDYKLENRELRGLYHYDVFPDIPAKWREVNRRALEGEVYREDMDCFERADGSVQWLRWEVRPWRNAAHEIGGIVIFTEDLTELHGGQVALQQSERLYRTLIEESPLAIAIHRHGKYIYFNPTADRMLGATSANNLVGKTVIDLIHPDSLEFVRARLAKLANPGATTPMAEMKLLKVDGTAIDVEAQGTAIVIDGVPTTYVIWHDISARKQAEAAREALEAQLRESQKMEAIGTLAGGIAHDFNNIIATILGNTALAQQDAAGNSKTLESLAEIHKASVRARELVRQIISFSRRQPPERKRTALGPVIDESMRLLRATLPARLILEGRHDACVPDVLADENQIHQVLINLANNAMQAIADGSGRIVMQLDTVMLDSALAATHPALADMFVEFPGPSVVLTVSDDGPGMDAATLERIFEPFFTTRPPGQGTGLGLSVVHGIVRGHDGAVLVSSRPGKGATFKIYLPAFLRDTDNSEVRVGEKSVGELAAEPGPGEDRHLLYIDDDEALVFVVKRLLERRGVRVSGYTDPREALAALRENSHAFDMVLTDYNMPGMSGLDVARAVRQIRADLPVAVASGFIDEKLRSESGEAGIRELVYKSTAVDSFCDVVQRMTMSGG
jgi:two-component system, cell cycle sensor histidine kinase and response regulator CckA